MPDHVLPPVSRPHVTFDQSVEDQLQGRDALLGVPDRAASASAPPDLEISSRSLFAFKADYSGIFSDIRMDEDYESFYNDNAERAKLPPPLPPSAIANTSISPLRPPRDTSIRDHSISNPLPISAVTQSVPPLPPRLPTATKPVYPVSVPSHSTPLSRHDSDASFEELIFRETRAMRPMSSAAYNQASREEHARVSEFRPPPHTMSQLDQGATHPSAHNPVPPRLSPSPPPPGVYESSRQMPQRPPEGLRKVEPLRKSIMRVPQRHPSPPPKPVSSAASSQQSMAAQQKDQQNALWKLEHMSLKDRDNLPSISTSNAPTYSSMSMPYDSRSTYAQPYAYGQSAHAAPGAAAAAAAAAAAVAAAQHSSQSPYLPPTHRMVAGQDWSSQPSGIDSSHRPASSYDRADGMVSPFLTANGSAVADMFGIDNPDDPHVYAASPQALSSVQYAAMGGYRDAASSILPTSRGPYMSQHNNHVGSRGGTRGRSTSPHRMEAAGSSYGYGMYSNANTRSPTYADVRGRALPVSAEYLNAQAAAAAAAAAAAVYQSNGVHINNSSSLGPLRSNGMSMSQSRGMPNRNTRSGDARRSGVGHQDGYSRGSNGTMSRSMNPDRGLLDRGNAHNDGLSASTAGAMKFSSFSDVVGRAEELARDQHGCRFLQTKLEEGNVVYINSIFEECYEKFVDLMTDPFGNYLCQKLFEFCNDAQRLALVERCAPAIPHVSTNMHGTRAVQRMVECLSTPEQVQAVCDALRPAAVTLMKDINGNHVIQRCLHRMDPAHNQFVYDAVAANCFELATHRHGCCVMQRCMDYASPMQRNQLAQQINANALPLVQNAFGNYVVQYVLELKDPVYTTEIIRRLRGHLADLSRQKFSSNVVEKGLQLGSRETRRELIDELIADQETMRRLLHDAYGNYVIQRALQVAEGPQLERICEAIRPHLHSLKQSPYGKRIQAKILKRMPKGIGPLPPTV